MIERFGDAYVVRYSKDGAPWYSGVGIRKGKTFCLSWAVQGQAGVGLFQIESNMRLVGRYTGYSPQNTPGLLETETLTRTDTR